MDFLKKMPAWGKALGLAILGVLILVVAWTRWWKPVKEDNVKLAKKEDELDEEIKKGEDARKRARELERFIADKKAELDKLKTILPADSEWSTLARTIEQYAAEQQIEILSSAPSAAKTHPEGLYMEQAYTYKAMGSYHNLALFFEKISRMKRIMNVKSITITARKGGGKSGLGDRLDCQFSAVAYMQAKDLPPAPAAPAKAAKGKKRPKAAADDSGGADKKGGGE